MNFLKNKMNIDGFALRAMLIIKAAFFQILGTPGHM